MKPGMKVKTEQGYTKVLKVVKDNRPYGDKLVRYKKSYHYRPPSD